MGLGFSSSTTAASQDSNTTNNSVGTGTNTQTGLSTAIQDPLATNFREGLYGQYNNAINQAQVPVYGQGFVANATGQANTQAQNSTDALKQTLAGSGGLDSGALAAGASGIQQSKDANLTSLNASIPALNEQAKAAQLQPLLSSASGLAGQAPISTATSGDSSYQTSLNDVINSILHSSTTTAGGGFSL
jgi:hypothetical protein